VSDIESERQQVRHLLEVEDGAGKRPVLLEAATYSIGRDASNSIVLHSKLVSRQHAVLLRVTASEPSTYLFRIVDGDLQGKPSTNGIWINGRRCPSHDLKPGDTIIFAGDVRAKYYAVSNLSDQEFAEFCNSADVASFLSKSSNPFQTLVPLEEQDSASLSEAALVRQASFPELTPNPILEINLSGVVTYLNPSALMQFPNIQKLGVSHPILAGLLTMVQSVPEAQEKYFVREVEIGEQIYEQSVHHIVESELIRSYVSDITERKRAEEQLRQQAQREAVINRIVQAMRSTMVTSEVLQITADLLLEALDVSDCLILQQGTQVTIGAHEPQTEVNKSDLLQANNGFLRHYEQLLRKGNQVFATGTDKALGDKLLGLVKICSIKTLVITPLFYMQEYLGSISLYQCGEAAPVPEDLGFSARTTSPLGLSTAVENKDYHQNLDELNLVKTIADQCAIAIHQAQLYLQVQDLNADLERQVQERTAQLRQKMQELQRLNALKDDFLSAVSHELRTPMANIKMAIHMLKQFPMDTKQERYLKILAIECSRETELINDLLDLQRLEAGANPVGLEPLNLSVWLPNVLEPFQNRTQQRKQVLQIDYPQNLLTFKSNRNALERILVELLNNACKYTPAEGEISLVVQNVHQPEPMILFKVGNQSEIPTSELPRIFDKFYRIPNADPWKQGGTGLGLALVKKLVEQLQGKILVSSQGGHTVFTVELPLVGDTVSASN
jgi:signal transduction histidine kinase/pSer/pThr/pTyr-binding forkhead associated (FHA) protein/predicted nucleic acid-binding protein